MTDSPYYQVPGLVSRISLGQRRKMYEIFMSRFGDAASILDLGVTVESVAPEANYLEKLHPHTERITAAGIEGAGNLETEFPGLRFVQVEAGRPLPFADNEFDVVFCHAVVEHVVDDGDRRAFIDETLRVGRAAFITTPNKYFPIEPHTMVPLLHFLWEGGFFRYIARFGHGSFYSRETLRLLSRRDFSELLGKPAGYDVAIHAVRLLGTVSNWVAILEPEA